MYLCDHDLEEAVKNGQLIVDPPPSEYDTSSIDVHLDSVDTAKVWNAARYAEQQRAAGHDPAIVRIGGFDYKAFAKSFHERIPSDGGQLVYLEGNHIIVRPHGYFLWQTREVVGTPEVEPRFICFVDGKSTKARAGLLVHMTAPNIHAGWWGKITLEIANLGPFNLGLAAGDAIAQIVVAKLTSPPTGKKKALGVRIGQKSVGGETIQNG